MPFQLKRYELTSWRVENPKMVYCQMRNPSIEHVLRWWRCNAPVKLEWCASWVVGNEASFWEVGYFWWNWSGFPLGVLFWKLPSGKRWHNYGKSPFLVGKSTINYQRLLEGHLGTANDQPSRWPRCWTTRSWDQRPHGSPRSVLDSWPGAPKPVGWGQSF